MAINFRPNVTNFVRCGVKVLHCYYTGQKKYLPCKLKASCWIDDVPMCGHHAGAELFRRHMRMFE